MNKFAYLQSSFITFLLLVCFGSLAADPGSPELQVENTERAFARTMADRDFDAFKSFLSEETIFFAGETPMRGSEAVAAAWEGYFQEARAPFSWEPQTVVVIDSGTLAQSSGPVFDPDGNRVATFNSVWRLDQDGQWRIVFDKGYPFCPPPPPADSD